MKFALAVSPVFATVAVIETLNVEGVYITSGAWTDIVPDVFVSSDSDVTMNSLLSELAETSIPPPLRGIVQDIRDFHSLSLLDGNAFRWNCK